MSREDVRSPGNARLPRTTVEDSTKLFLEDCDPDVEWRAVFRMMFGGEATVFMPGRRSSQLLPWQCFRQGEPANCPAADYRQVPERNRIARAIENSDNTAGAELFKELGPLPQANEPPAAASGAARRSASSAILGRQPPTPTAASGREGRRTGAGRERVCQTAYSPHALAERGPAWLRQGCSVVEPPDCQSEPTL